MKYVYIPIFARNVYFPPLAENQFNLLLAKAANPSVVKWLKSNFRNWIMNKAKLPLLKTNNVLLKKPEIPDWVRNKIDTEDIFFVQTQHINGVLNVRTRDVVEYLNTLPQNKLPKISVEDAVVKTCDYIADREKRQTEKRELEERASLKLVHKYDDGFRWVENCGKNTLIKEGEEMQNCLQEPTYNWYRKVSSGKTKIYSLRDASNHPHISIEFDVPTKEIVQIKGKQNDPVVAKYRPYLVDFLKKNYIGYKTVDSVDLRDNNLTELI